jgi:hypothetical protein
MLIPVQHLVDRLRYPRSRADDVADVRRRLVAQPTRAALPAEAARAADDVARARLALAAALEGVRACSGCARGYPEPHGHWDGGHCCGGATSGVFTDDELAALRASGTTPSRLVPPEGDHAGCAFRGPRGCSLGVADRPAVCVRYTCRGLEAELRARGDWKAIARLQEDLRRAFARFCELRAPASTSPQVPA